MGKKLLLATVAAVGLTMGIASAKAADLEPVAEPLGWYVSLFGGASWLDDVKTDYEDDNIGYGNEADTDVGFIIGGAVGTHLTEDIRVELEVAYSENDTDDEVIFEDADGSHTTYDGHADYSFLTFMGNIWYDIPLSEELKPYVGGGAGVAIVDGEFGYDGEPDDRYDSSEVTFAFQVGAGLRWAVLENVTLDVGYRLRGIDGPDFEHTDVTSGLSDFDADWMWSHNVIAGITFGF